MNQNKLQEAACPIEKYPELTVDDQIAGGACDPVEVFHAHTTNPSLPGAPVPHTVILGETIRFGGSGGGAYAVLNACAGQLLRFRCGSVIDAVATETTRHYGGPGGSSMTACSIPVHGCIRLTLVETAVLEGYTVLSRVEFECDGVPVCVRGSTTEGKCVFFSAPGLWVQIEAFHFGEFLDAISFRTVLQGPCPGASLRNLFALRLGGCGGGLVVRADGCAGQQLSFTCGFIIDALFVGPTRYGGAGGTPQATCSVPSDGRIRLIRAETAVLHGFTVLSRLQFEAGGEIVDVRGYTGEASQVFFCPAGLWVRIEELHVGWYLDAITFRVL